MEAVIILIETETHKDIINLFPRWYIYCTKLTHKFHNFLVKYSFLHVYIKMSVFPCHCIFYILPITHSLLFMLVSKYVPGYNTSLFGIIYRLSLQKGINSTGNRWLYKKSNFFKLRSIFSFEIRGSLHLEHA